MSPPLFDALGSLESVNCRHDNERPCPPHAPHFPPNNLGRGRGNHRAPLRAGRSRPEAAERKAQHRRSSAAGGRGDEDLEDLKSENIVALCDVDWDRAAATFRQFPNATRYRDFREMLDKEKDIDAVVVGTPDHIHAVVSMTAIKPGKHVYCEKPLTRTVYEARALAKAAREAKVATQMGNQGMAFEGNRLINEWLADGAIGPVREVHVWSDRPTHRGKLPLYWAAGHRAAQGHPAGAGHARLGPLAGPRPLAAVPSRLCAVPWRGWWDFGSGGLGDMGIHNLAPVFSALKLGAPEQRPRQFDPGLRGDAAPGRVVHYEFPARGDLPPVKLHWYDGGILPPRPEELEDDRDLNREDGILFVGDKGKMLVEGWGGEKPRLIPETRNREYKRPPKTLPRSIGHHQEWIAGLQDRHGHPLQLSTSPARSPKPCCWAASAFAWAAEKLLWDSANLKVTNLPEANQYLHYEYRQGWSL